MKALIADDDPACRRLLKSLLDRMGIESTVTRDGVEAWRSFQTVDPPQWAILDWMMPRMDGVELCRKVRASSRGRRTYIILLTAKNTVLDVVSGIQSGANDYVRKPFDREEFLARLQAAARTVLTQTGLESRVDQLEKRLQKAADPGLFGETSAGTYRASLTGEILDCTDSLASLLGYPGRRELFAANLFRDLIAQPADCSRWQYLMARKGAVQDLAMTWRRFDGHPVNISESVRSATDETGNVLYYEGVVTHRRTRPVASSARPELVSRIGIRIGITL
ncbi:response regulator [bacterium]|nr:response regulator [bacterium]